MRGNSTVKLINIPLMWVIIITFYKEQNVLQDTLTKAMY